MLCYARQIPSAASPTASARSYLKKPRKPSMRSEIACHDWIDGRQSTAMAEAIASPPIPSPAAAPQPPSLAAAPVVQAPAPPKPQTVVSQILEDKDDDGKVSRWQIGSSSLGVLEQVYQMEPFPGECQFAPPEAWKIQQNFRGTAAAAAPHDARRQRRCSTPPRNTPGNVSRLSGLPLPAACLAGCLGGSPGKVRFVSACTFHSPHMRTLANPLPLRLPARVASVRVRRPGDTA